MAFPSTLYVHTTVVDNVDDVLATHINTPGVNVEGLCAKIGIDGSSVITSHDYLLRHLPTQEQNLDIGNYELRAKTFVSDQSDGTAPITVTSTTKCTNLNAEKVDGFAFRTGDCVLSSNTNTPTGWADVSATYTDKFIRISSGTPLSTGGTNTHTHGGTVGSTTLTAAQSGLVAHSHLVFYDAQTNAALSSSNYPASTYSVSDDMATQVRGQTNIPNAGKTKDATSANASASHTHSVTTADNIPVYVQLKMYQKS